jgi:hypothetical protein
VRPSPILPVVATVLFALGVVAVLASAGSTLGYDFQAYVGAARRLLSGQPLYDPAVNFAGGFAVYLYPPPFAIALIPFALLSPAVATWLWLGILVAAFLVATALLPVRPTVRWIILLLGGIDWPLLYGLKLGQVGPLLFLLFALAWRAIDRPTAQGLASGIGTLIKLQPAVLLLWAALTRRFVAVATGVGLVTAVSAISIVVVGVSGWTEYVRLLGRVASPVATPHNFTPGAVAFQLGVPESTAIAIELAAMGSALVALILAVWATRSDASLLVAIVASQLLSPLLWDHYAIVLLLPVAWLLERGHWWALAVPLATSLPLVGITPAIAYPLMFGICLFAPIVVGWRRPMTTGAQTAAPSLR